MDANGAIQLLQAISGAGGNNNNNNNGGGFGGGWGKGKGKGSGKGASGDYGVCFSWRDYGRCWAGDQCRFRHDGNEKMLSLTEDDENSETVKMKVHKDVAAILKKTKEDKPTHDVLPVPKGVSKAAKELMDYFRDKMVGQDGTPVPDETKVQVLKQLTSQVTNLGWTKTPETNEEHIGAIASSVMGLAAAVRSLQQPGTPGPPSNPSGPPSNPTTPNPMMDAQLEAERQRMNQASMTLRQDMQQSFQIQQQRYQNELDRLHATMTQQQNQIQHLLATPGSSADRAIPVGPTGFQVPPIPASPLMMPPGWNRGQLGHMPNAMPNAMPDARMASPAASPVGSDYLTDTEDPTVDPTTGGTLLSREEKMRQTRQVAEQAAFTTLTNFQNRWEGLVHAAEAVRGCYEPLFPTKNRIKKKRNESLFSHLGSDFASFLGASPPTDNHTFTWETDQAVSLAANMTHDEINGFVNALLTAVPSILLTTSAPVKMLKGVCATWGLNADGVVYEALCKVVVAHMCTRTGTMVPWLARLGQPNPEPAPGGVAHPPHV